MSSPDAELDRNEAATPHKLEEARKKGQVAKSTEIVSAAVFAVAVVWLSMSGWATLSAHVAFDRALIARVAQAAGPIDLWPLLAGAIGHALVLLAPLLGAVVLAAIVANLVQTGPLLAFEPLKPDWSRISPATGWKRVMSLRTLFETARAVVKLLLLVAVVWAAIAALVPQFFRLALLSPSAQARLLIDDAASLGFRLAMALALVAVLDAAWTRREHGRRMRMSRREIKDEWKNREGDPRIRNRLRELRREMLKRTRSLARTRDADLVVVNPTHLAVALRYRHGEMAAPVLLAKGAGGMAAAIRAVAARHRIPVVSHRSLARSLYAAASLEQPIPAETFAPVARLMAWVLAMRAGGPGMKALEELFGRHADLAVVALVLGVLVVLFAPIPAPLLDFLILCNFCFAFLPFLLIDLIVSSVLMALGMMMMPPITVALPIKLLMFVLVDGWSLLLKALLGSFR